MGRNRLFVLMMLALVAMLATVANGCGDDDDDDDDDVGDDDADDDAGDDDADDDESDDDESDDDDEDDDDSHDDDDDPHWDYEHPDDWSDEYPACDDMEQSPVDLTGESEVDLDNIDFAWTTTTISLANNGHTVVATPGDTQTFEVDGTTYTMDQFHYHVSSEHQEDGAYHDAEFHFVHQDEGGNYAVIGIFMNEDEVEAANADWDVFINNLPDEDDTAEPVDEVTLSNLLPATRTYYAYDGSFTTPPCTEGVLWFVLDTPVELSTTQLNALKAKYDDNFRPVQPIGARTIEHDSTP
ncbi:carbonic anhydrase family protein [bacterium]|nr:carbonic anhydrase family protein [bacterium]